ncbi:FG-GAP-like repeat-containing protein [Thalassotalea nanhaiensis]|uniref:FG-GAP-like repeat-containing protein n=1 Tax=Thalassotalea nanhaiensis TaxID=3065648 RepID=A0ABY9TFJ8_9GAMM|nr:FG-GAP-like repeat-containing protein [Colwelliaceae bacterium SQ345]
MCLFNCKTLSNLVLLSCLFSCSGESNKSKNTKPEISATSLNEVYEFEDFSLKPIIIDADNDALSLSISNLPSWAKFNVNTGEVYGVPEINDAGLYENITITADDGKESANASISINVKQTVVLNGKVLSGYISGAKVYLDTNLNSKLDIDEEPSSITDERGSFTFYLRDENIDNFMLSPLRALISVGADDVTREDDNFEVLPVDLARMPYLQEIPKDEVITGQVISPLSHLAYARFLLIISNANDTELSTDDFKSIKQTVISENEATYGFNGNILFGDFLSNSELSAEQVATLTSISKTALTEIQLQQSPIDDSDADGVINRDDAFPFDSNEYQDSDFDGIGNNADDDDDGDGVVDSEDAFPLDPSENADFDLDGIGDNLDNDDDNDGFIDTLDDFPFDSSEHLDTDNDGIGNNRDRDDDGDNVFDVEDFNPVDINERYDTDSDGIANSVDLDDDNDGILDIDDLYPLDTNLTDISSISTENLTFSNTTQLANLLHYWGIEPKANTAEVYQTLLNAAGGMAAGDYDNDGDIDVFIIGGEHSLAKLYQNDGKGVFVDIAKEAGVQLLGLYSGPSFADTDNDGDLDLFVGGLNGNASYLFVNQGDSTFTKKVAFKLTDHVVSSSFSDIDNNGDLDLIVSRYGSKVSDNLQYLWRNNSNNNFINIDDEAGLNNALVVKSKPIDFSFSSSFADINNDGYADLLLASDFVKSSLLVNDQTGTFADSTHNMNISVNDLSGMGSAIADYDNDGDLDWFIGGIFALDPTTGSLSHSGNKLLQNDGSGVFKDVSYISGISDGGWSWGSCFADFNNDGHQDIFQTNGWTSYGEREQGTEDFNQDTVKLFIADGNGGFDSQNTKLGLTEKGQGRAVVCFDADNDGDIDLLLQNNDDGKNALVFYENVNGSNLGNFLKLKLTTPEKNRFAIGAKVTINVANTTQMREVNINNNFTSHNPAELHFGLADHSKVERITIEWPNGHLQIITDVDANQSLIIEQ